MAENDIYNSQSKYEKTKTNIDEFLKKPEERKNKGYKGKYYCKYSGNLIYFKKLFLRFESEDISYIRRNRLIDVFKLICFVAEKDLKDFEREDVDGIIRYMHTVNVTPTSKQDFIKSLKHIWKILFPEKDEKERIDENIVPYAVRHIKAKVDRSREKTKLLNPKHRKVELMDAETDTFYDSSGYYYPRNVFCFSYGGKYCSGFLSMVQNDLLEGHDALGPWGEVYPDSEYWRKHIDAKDFGYYINKRGRLFKRIKNTSNVVPSSYKSMQKYCRKDKIYREKVVKKLKELKIK